MHVNPSLVIVNYMYPVFYRFGLLVFLDSCIVLVLVWVWRLGYLFPPLSRVEWFPGEILEIYSFSCPFPLVGR